MHALTSNWTSNLNATHISQASGQIFEGIKFIRLSEWKECGRSTALAGGTSCAGQIFRRYELKKDTKVVLEFWFRGNPLSDGSAQAFSELLKEPTDLDDEDLESVSEVWRGSVEGRMLGGVQHTRSNAQLVYEIDGAEIGDLQGRRMLAIWWKHCLLDRKFLSIFMDAEDGPGYFIHEVHFSAPTDVMHRQAATIVETLRSFQWSKALPPPLVPSSSSRLSA